MGKTQYKKFAMYADTLSILSRGDSNQVTITKASALLELLKRKISRSVRGEAMAYKLFRTKAGGTLIILFLY